MDESRAEELLAEYGDYDDDIKLYHVSGTCLLGEFADLLRAFIRDSGDAATMRGFLNENHMTPSMVVSLMMHWQKRALAAEAKALVNSALGIEENDGNEQLGNWSATDPVKAEDSDVVF